MLGLRDLTATASRATSRKPAAGVTLNGRLTVVRALVARLLAVMILFALPSSDSSRAGWPNLPRRRRRRPTSSRLSLSPVFLVDFTRIPFDFYLSSRSPPPRSFSFLDTRTSFPSLLRSPPCPCSPFLNLYLTAVVCPHS